MPTHYSELKVLKLCAKFSNSEMCSDKIYMLHLCVVSKVCTLESRINEQVVYQKNRKIPTYTHLFGTIRLLIFIKKSHLYVYSHLYFYSFLNFHIFFQVNFMVLSLNLQCNYHAKVLIHSLKVRVL